MASTAPRRWTAGRTDRALWRLIREMTDAETRYPDDPVLSRLDAARRIAVTLDQMVDGLIEDARRGRRNPRYSWRRIGEAMGVTGQAVGLRARTRHLHVRRLTPDAYAELVAKGRAALGRPS